MHFGVLLAAVLFGLTLVVVVVTLSLSFSQYGFWFYLTKSDLFAAYLMFPCLRGGAWTIASGTANCIAHSLEGHRQVKQY